MNMLKRLWKEEEGQALTEYGLIIGLIAVVCIAAVALLGDQLVALFNKLTAELGVPSGVTS